MAVSIAMAIVATAAGALVQSPTGALAAEAPVGHIRASTPTWAGIIGGPVVAQGDGAEDGGPAPVTADLLVSEQARRDWQVLDIQPAVDSSLPDWDVLVWDFAELNGVMYVGGRFRTVRKYSGAAEHNQPFLAAFDVNTGEWISTFRPRLDDGVYALAPSPDGRRLLVGGEFTSVNDAPLTSGLAALDPFTGQPDPLWKASLSEEQPDRSVVVHDIVTDAAADTVYVAGNFSHVESAEPDSRTRRYNIARLDGTSGALDHDWDLKAGGGRVMALALSPDGSTVYAGGFFTTLGQSEQTKWLGRASTLDATVTPMADPLPPDLNNYVFDIAATDDSVFVATERHRLWIYDPATGALTNEYLASGHGGDPQALHVQDDTVWVGGHFHGWIRDENGDGSRLQVQWLTPFDDTTNAPVPDWYGRLGMTDGVFAVTTDSLGRLWVGGDPTSSGTVPTRGFAVFAPRQGAGGSEINLARGRVAGQSQEGDSNLVGSKGTPENRCDDETNNLVGPAGQAVDGKIGGGIYECSFTATTSSLRPHWEVDLGAQREVDAIRIWNLYGIPDEQRLADVHIAVSPEPITTSDPDVLATQPEVWLDRIDGQLDWYHEQPVGVFGRYIRVFLNSPQPQQLRLAEVEVLDLPDVSPPLPPDDGGSELVIPGSTWRYLDDGGAPPPDWAMVGFDDASWATGAAPLGFGDDDLATTTATEVLTTYFRQTFEADDLGPDVSALTLELVADDGAVVHLNGQEVYRLRMPVEPVDHTTPSADTVWGAAERAWTNVTIPADAMVAGTNVLAVEIHNNWRRGGDIRVDAALSIPEGPVEPPPVDQVLIPAEADWLYLDSGIDPGPAWTALGFDDAVWSTGAAQLGYGDGDESTVVSEGPVPDRHITTWFRTEFDLGDPSEVASLDLSLIRDDGAVVYLNGHELVRSNLPDGPIGADTAASDYAWGLGESDFHRFSLPADALAPGANLVAVEVHSADPGSSDISFDLRLIGVAP